MSINQATNSPSVTPSFAELFEESIKKENFQEGSVIQGKVVHIGKDYVLVDVGYKSEGQVPVSEFPVQDGKPVIHIGDSIEVFLDRLEGDNGLCQLSKVKADRMKVWDVIESVCEKDELIEGVVLQRVKGGLAVELQGGLEAFLPGSQVDLRPVRNLDTFIGKTYPFKVIKFNKRRGNIVVSRRTLLEKERAQLKENTLERLSEGQVVDGIIKNITEYGVFVDLGGIDGLLHITDMSWGRVTHPSEMFHVGEQVRVKVLKFNSETERVSLGLKQISEDPWSYAAQKYVPGTVVKGKVVSLKDYGAFIEIEEGIEGLIHVSEMSWTRRIKHPSKVLAVGDTVEAVVLDVDTANSRISLGMKQLEPNPYESILEKYPIGTRIKGQIRNVTDFGLFVELEEGIDGLVHISDISWTQRIKHPSEIYSKNDEIEAVVLNIDTTEERPKLSLGIKQLVDDPWNRIPVTYPIGKVVTASILKVFDFGIFVELEPGVEGLIHISEASYERIEDPKQLFKVGQEIKAEVISIDAAERKIALSIRSAKRSEDVSMAQGLSLEQGGSGGAKLGDIFAKQKDGKKKK